MVKLFHQILQSTANSQLTPESFEGWRTHVTLILQLSGRGGKVIRANRLSSYVKQEEVLGETDRRHSITDAEKCTQSE